MASLGAGFLPQEEQKLSLTRNLGDALAAVARRVFGKDHAVSKIEREWGLDRTTAKNVLKGVVGAVPVTKAVRAQQDKHRNGWALWDALGELIIGEPRDAYEERVLQLALAEAENVYANLTLRRQRRAALLQGADPLVAPGLREGEGGPPDRLGRPDGRQAGGRGERDQDRRGAAARPAARSA